MPTGWRPQDVAEKYPVYKIDDAYHFEKFDTAATPLLYAWSWMQLSILLLLISWLFGNLTAIGSPAMFIYGAFVFVYVYCVHRINEQKQIRTGLGFSKNISGIAIIWYYGGWFGADKFYLDKCRTYCLLYTLFTYYRLVCFV
jgi:hypothetical protein